MEPRELIRQRQSKKDKYITKIRSTEDVSRKLAMINRAINLTETHIPFLTLLHELLSIKRQGLILNPQDLKDYENIYNNLIREIASQRIIVARQNLAKSKLYIDKKYVLKLVETDPEELKKIGITDLSQDLKKIGITDLSPKGLQRLRSKIAITIPADEIPDSILDRLEIDDKGGLNSITRFVLNDLFTKKSQEEILEGIKYWSEILNFSHSLGDFYTPVAIYGAFNNFALAPFSHSDLLSEEIQQVIQNIAKLFAGNPGSKELLRDSMLGPAIPFIGLLKQDLDFAGTNKDPQQKSILIRNVARAFQQYQKLNNIVLENYGVDKTTPLRQKLTQGLKKSWDRFHDVPVEELAQLFSVKTDPEFVTLILSQATADYLINFYVNLTPQAREEFAKIAAKQVPYTQLINLFTVILTNEIRQNNLSPIINTINALWSSDKLINEYLLYRTSKKLLHSLDLSEKEQELLKKISRNIVTAFERIYKPNEEEQGTLRDIKLKLIHHLLSKLELNTGQQNSVNQYLQQLIDYEKKQQTADEDSSLAGERILRIPDDDASDNFFEPAEESSAESETHENELNELYEEAPQASTEKEMEVIIMTDFDGTLTDVAGDELVVSDFYRGLLKEPPSDPTEEFDYTNELLDHDELIKKMKSSFDDFEQNNNWHDPRRMNMEAVAFLKKMLQTPNTHIAIFSHNQERYIKALLEIEGFSPQEISRIKIYDYKWGAKQNSAFEYLTQHSSDTNQRSILIFEDTESGAKALTSVAGNNARKVSTIRKDPGNFDWQAYDMQVNDARVPEPEPQQDTTQVEEARVPARGEQVGFLLNPTELDDSKQIHHTATKPGKAFDLFYHSRKRELEMQPYPSARDTHPSKISQIKSRYFEIESTLEEIKKLQNTETSIQAARSYFSEIKTRDLISGRSDFMRSSDHLHGMDGNEKLEYLGTWIKSKKRPVEEFDAHEVQLLQDLYDIIANDESLDGTKLFASARDRREYQAARDLAKYQDNPTLANLRSTKCLQEITLQVLDNNSQTTVKDDSGRDVTKYTYDRQSRLDFLKRCIDARQIPTSRLSSKELSHIKAIYTETAKREALKEVIAGFRKAKTTKEKLKFCQAFVKKPKVVLNNEEVHLKEAVPYFEKLVKQLKVIKGIEDRQAANVSKEPKQKSGFSLFSRKSSRADRGKEDKITRSSGPVKA